MKVYLDASDGLAPFGQVAVWTFDLDNWGECGQGSDEDSALAQLARRTGTASFDIVERIEGPLQVFERDLQRVSDDERRATIGILERHRALTLALIKSTSPAKLALADPHVAQPEWMTWRSAEAIAWHIADTESRGYPRRLGLQERPPESDLAAELQQSLEYVRLLVETVPGDLTTMYKTEKWTATKFLRRLAWHERVEQVFLTRRLRGTD